MTLKVSMQHWVLEYYQVCSNDDPGMTLTYFTAKSNWSPMLLYGKKVKQWILFSETIVVYDIKVGRCSQLNEHMKLYGYQRSRSIIDLGPNHSDSIFSNCFSSITIWPIKANFYVKSPWDKGTKACSNCLGHITKMTTMSIYGKIL